MRYSFDIGAKKYSFQTEKPLSDAQLKDMIMQARLDEASSAPQKRNLAKDYGPAKTKRTDAQRRSAREQAAKALAAEQMPAEQKALRDVQGADFSGVMASLLAPIMSNDWIGGSGSGEWGPNAPAPVSNMPGMPERVTAATSRLGELLTGLAPKPVQDASRVAQTVGGVGGFAARAIPEVVAGAGLGPARVVGSFASAAFRNDLNPWQRIGGALDVATIPGQIEAGIGTVKAIANPVAWAKKSNAKIYQAMDQALRSKDQKAMEALLKAHPEAFRSDIQFDLPAHGDLVSPGEMPGATFRKPTGKAGLTAGQRAAVVSEGQPLYRGGVRDSQGGYSYWTPNKDYALNYSPDGTVHEAKAPSGLYDWIGDEKKHEEFRSFLRAELDKADPQTLSELNDAKTARELLDGPLDPKATGRASVLVGFAKHGGFAKTPIASEMKAFMERKGIGAMVDVESDGSYSVLMRNSAEPRATGQAVPDKGLEPTNVPKAPEPSPKPTPASPQTVRVYHGSADANKAFKGGEFFTDNQKEAANYADLAVLRKYLHDNPDADDLIVEILSEEGADDITDMGLKEVRMALEVNGFTPPKTKGSVSAVDITLNNPLDLRELGGEIKNVEKTWRELHKRGLVSESWDDMDEFARQELKDEYKNKAAYKLFEKEGVYDNAFRLGHDSVVFTDQGLGGRSNHDSYILKGSPRSEPSPKPTPAATVNVEPTVGTSGAKEPWQMTRSQIKGEKPEVRTNGTIEPGGVARVNGSVRIRKVNEVGNSVWRAILDDGTIISASNDKPSAVRAAKEWAQRQSDNVARNRHRGEIAQALKDGKPVPPEVLADYPDLVAKYGKAEPPKPTGPTLSDAVANPTGKAQGVTPESFTRKPLETKAPYQGTNGVSGKANSTGVTLDQMHGRIGSLSKNNQANADALGVVRATANNPESRVTIYRATTGGSINPGDWVFLTKAEAERFAKTPISGRPKPGVRVIESQVAAGDVGWSGKNLEFVYDPSAGVRESRITEPSKPKPDIRKSLTTEPPMQGPSRATGLANQVQEREALQGVINEVVGTKGHTREHWQDIGRVAVEQGDIDPFRLADQIANGEVELTGERVGALLEGKRRMLAALKADKDALTPKEYEAAQSQLDDYLAKIQMGKGRWHDVGMALQSGASIDYGNYEEVLAHVRRHGVTTNPKMEAEFQRMTEDLARATEARQAAEASAEKLRQSVAEANIRKASGKAIGKNVEAVRNDARRRLWGTANTFVTQDQMQAAWQLLRSYAAKGDDVEGLIAKVRQVEKIPENITDEDLKLAIAVAGNPSRQKAAVSEITKAINALRKEAKQAVGLADEEAAARIQRNIADLENQLKTGDYKLPAARDAMYSPEVQALKNKEEHLRRLVQGKIADVKTPMLVKGMREGTNLIRGAVLGTDMGQIGRQGLFAWSNPVEAFKGLKAAAYAIKSPENLIEIERQIAEQRINGQMVGPIQKRAGLSLTNELVTPEEIVVGNLLKKIPVIGKLAGRPLERAQLAFINTVRAERFNYGVRHGFTDAELKDTAHFVNSVFGRSNVKRVPDALATLMTSPRFEASRWETLWSPFKNTGKIVADLTTGKGLNRAAAKNLRDIGVTVGEVYGAYKLMEMAGWKGGGFDSNNPDFGKMRRGDQVVDFTAGMAPRLRDIFKLFVMAKDGPDYLKNIGSTAMKAGVRTVSPAIRVPITMESQGIQRLQGRTIGGEGKAGVNDPWSGAPLSEQDADLLPLMPLIFQSVKQAYEKGGLKEAAVTAPMEFFGAGVNYYPKKGAATTTPKTAAEKAVAEIQRNIKSKGGSELDRALADIRKKARP